MLLQLQNVGLILLQLFAGSEKMQPVMKPKVVSMSVIKDSLVQHGTHHFRFEYPGEDAPGPAPSPSDTPWNGFAVRRGYAFNVSIEVNAEVDCGVEFFRFQSASLQDQRFKVVRCHGKDTRRKSEDDSFFYVVEVTTSVLDPIARYNDITVSAGGDDERFQYGYPFPVYVLFNPYNPEDTSAYCPDKHFRKNYLEEESSVYFQGDISNVDIDHWYYAQYEPVMLEASFDLLATYNKDTSNYTLEDPKMAVRHILKTIGYWTESKPEQGNPHGILNGHWFDEDFSGGVNPDDWVSSFDIVDKWYKMGKTPVNYGQCWVFAAVGRSLFASLGLVSRQISGYSTTVDGSVTQYTDGLEAHTFGDGKSHHIVAFFMDESGKMRFQWGMVWNFHSWAEVYVNDPSEGKKYDGWHISDPTLPGEGPMPTKAVHDLVEDYDFDSTSFIGDVKSTLVYQLVKCLPEVDKYKLPANTTTCPTVKTLKVNARGCPLLLTSSDHNPQVQMEITASYANHSVDGFVPLPGGVKPYPEDMAEASLDHPEDPTAGAGSMLVLLPEEGLRLWVVKTSAVQGADGVTLVKAKVEVSCAGGAGVVRRVLLNAAGEVLRVNSARRLGSVLTHSSMVVLSRANKWRTTVDLTAPVHNAALGLNSKFRHVVHLGIVAKDKAAAAGDVSSIKFDHQVVMLPALKAKVKATMQLVNKELAAMQAAGVGAFEAAISSPFPVAVSNVCVTVRSLHHEDLGLDRWSQCFDTWAAGETKSIKRMFKETVAAGEYKLSFAVSSPQYPTTKTVHQLTVV